MYQLKVGPTDKRTHSHVAAHIILLAQFHFEGQGFLSLGLGPDVQNAGLVYFDLGRRVDLCPVYRSVAYMDIVINKGAERRVAVEIDHRVVGVFRRGRIFLEDNIAYIGHTQNICCDAVCGAIQIWRDVRRDANHVAAGLPCLLLGNLNYRLPAAGFPGCEPGVPNFYGSQHLRFFDY